MHNMNANKLFFNFQNAQIGKRLCHFHSGLNVSTINMIIEEV